MRVLAFIALLFLSACALLPQPKTPTEALGVAYATIARLAETTSTRLAAGAVTKAQAADILEALVKAKDLTDGAAVAIAAGRPTDALSTLQTVTALLTELETRLAQTKKAVYPGTTWPLYHPYRSLT